MKSLTLSYTGGDHEDFTVDDVVASEALAALTAQNPAFPLALSETAAVYVNMRNVTTLAIGAEEEAPVSDSDSDSTEGTPDSRTVADLKEALDAAEVEYDSRALKAELQALAAQHSV